ncbi:MAG: chemotaxis protein CheA [Deltaproteobacteria bacterium]|nr:chemotaxis protein CheA [Deltaproteobacteria bacterium]
MGLDDELVWSEYANDAGEALGAIEGALLALEAAPNRRDEIDRLYRGLHTIKGNSGFLRLAQIEHLAHAAEDLIGLVRDHGVPMESPLVDLLLIVVDRLREVVEAAGRDRRDAAPERVATLIADVEAARVARDPRGARAVPIVRDVAPVEVPAAAEVPIAVPVVVAPPTIGHDAELELIEPALDAGFVEVFLSMVADACPALGAAIVEAGDPATASAACAALVRITDDLGLAAERMGYVHVQDLLGRIAAAATAGGPRIAELPELELALYTQLVAVETSYAALTEAPQDFGVTAVYRRACALGAPADLAQLRAMFAAPALPGRDALRPLFARLRAACESHQLDSAVETLLEHEDRVARVLERGAVIGPDDRGPVLDLLAEIANAIHEDDVGSATIAIPTLKLPVMTVAESAGLPVSSAIRAQISPSIDGHLGWLRAAGTGLFELHVELERKADLAAGFHAWVARGRVKVVTSAVVPGPDGLGAYRFLMSSALPIAALRDELRAIDPGGQALRAHPLDGSEGPAPEVVAFAPSAVAAPAKAAPIAAPIAAPPARPPVRAAEVDPVAADPDDAEPARAAGGKTEFLRIDARKVSLIMDLAGELGLASGAVTHHPELVGLELEGFTAASHKLEVLIRELQSEVSAMRLVPVAGVFHRMRRVVRDTARRTGKRVELVLVGEETEIDKIMVDGLADPLVHMLRNAIDHGLETPDERAAAGKPPTGRIVLEASHQGGEVSITVADDGRGLDRDRILARATERGLIPPGAALTDQEAHELIFLPGFSTKEAIDELSGRGVGMDVVKSTIEGLRGRVHVRSTPGRGTQIHLAVPLTLAFVEAMIVGERDRLFAVPIEKVFEVFQVRADQIASNSADGQRLLRVRDSVVPVCWLSRFFDEVTDTSNEPLEGRIAVVVQTAHGSLALPIDRLLGNQQIMLKPLTGVLAGVRAAAGCGMLRSGDVALTLDCERLHA